ENDTTWDAGIVPQQYPPSLASLGDFVWLDVNEDGLQDGAEAGVSGVTVRLYDSSNVLQEITTTDSNGYYLFEDLNPGNYYVEFTAPNGYTFTLQNQGANDWLDSDADPVTGQTATTTLVAGDNDLKWDAGLIEELDPALAAIGNYVWEDLDKDGVQDPGEPGIANVQVNLYTSTGVLTGTTTTDLDGLYEFRDLTPGDYYIEVVPPVGYEVTTQDSGDDALDSDIDPVTGQTIPTMLVADEYDPTWDAGLVREEPNTTLASLGNFVWLDADQDGIQEAGEPGVPNVTVTLYDITGTIVATTTTDANGLYEFVDLTPADYYVQFATPAGYTLTGQDAGSDDTLDSDANVATGETTPTTLDPGENDITWDAGIYEVLSPTLAAIGNYVWFDSDQDGLQDVGEPGVQDVVVNLYDATNTPILTTTTNADGLYQFTDLAPADYYVEFELPNGYVYTDRDQESDDGVDSDADPDESSATFGQTILTTLDPGENDTTWDAGIYVPTPPATASIGDFVWLDNNVDGIQGVGEDGIQGVTVNLYDSAGNFVETTITDPTGYYQFAGLFPGDYYIEVVPPLGYAITLQNEGNNDLEDSDIDLNTGQTTVTTLTAGENDPTWDAGLYSALRLGNLVWYDSNNDGQFNDSVEQGIPGVVVELLDENGFPYTHPITGDVMTTTTDANGNYEFTNLPPGTYIVNIPTSNFDENDDILFGFSSSRDDAAVDPVTDPDSDPTDGDDDGINVKFPAESGVRSNPITLEAGNEATTDTADEDGSLPDDNSNLSVDFGFFELLSLGNQLWFDTNSDGRYDPEETGVPAGVVLNLLDGNGDPVINPDTGRPITTTTGTDGTYQFTNLYPGDYMINIDASAFQAGGPLEGYISSTGATDPDDDSDRDDNGIDGSNPAVNGIDSGVITLNYNAEPAGGADGDDNDNTNFTVDFGVVLEPTAVELVSFSGSWTGGTNVKIEWRTAAEINNFGFKVMRNQSLSLNNASQVAFVAAPSSASMAPGNSYGINDNTPDFGTYYYWLVDVDTNGHETVHGPIQVTTSPFWTLHLPLINR
ncbi:MAG: SdrD B-like domain-containing protein, partial [Chloroflexota bacterium]